MHLSLIHICCKHKLPCAVALLPCPFFPVDHPVLPKLAAVFAKLWRNYPDAASKAQQSLNPACSNRSAADDLHRFHNLICLFLKPFLTFFGDCQHGRRAEGIAGVYAQRIDILNKAHCNHVVIGVTNHLQLQLFPAQYRFLYENLSYKAGLEASGAYSLQFFFIVNQAAAGAAHGIDVYKRQDEDRADC